jgi:hypothetical protein
LVTDYDSGDAFGAAVGVERIRYCFSSLQIRGKGMEQYREDRFTILLDILPLAGFCTLRDRFAEQGHELGVAGSGVGRQGILLAENR